MNKPKVKISTQEKVTLVIVTAVSIGVLVFAGVAYKDYRHKHTVSDAQHAAQQKVIDDNIALAKAKQAAIRQIDINRLIAICAAAKIRYESLTAKQQILEVRPDCTLHSVQ